MEPLPPPSGVPVAHVPPPTGPAPDAPQQGPVAWRWWQGVGGLFAALAGASVAGVIVFGVAAIFGGDATDPTGGMYMASLAVQDICFVGFAVMFGGLRGGPAAAWMFGLRSPRPGWKQATGWIALAYAALLAFSLAWSQVVSLDGGQLTDDLGVKANDVAAVAGALLVCVLAPIAEEFLFRGLIFPALRGSVGTAWAAAGTGVLFGAVHVIGSPVGALLPLALFGAMLCIVYLKTQSLLACMVLHALNNAFAYGSLVDWTWQVPVTLVGAIALILAAFRLLESRLGPSPSHLTSV
jgi:membrane protease YdiL (CAAX protease family)